MKTRFRLLAALLAICSVPAWAQSAIYPENEYKKLIRVDEEISPLGESPFGESLSLYDGSLSFTQTDISVPGTGPSIEITRTFKADGDIILRQGNAAFGDWDIEIPRLTTITSDEGNYVGWLVNSLVFTDRCTNMREPPWIVPKAPGSGPVKFEEWWNEGYRLHVPGMGSQDVLSRSDKNPLIPQMSGQTFVATTKSHWMISCLGSTANGEPGEAFLVTSPNGTKYWLNYLVYRRARDFVIGRKMGYMLATRVEDRFGNWVTYSYNAGKLNSIDASDGRRVTFGYTSDGSQIAQVSVITASESRSWSYSYKKTGTGYSLTRVGLPDGSEWNYQFENLGYEVTSPLDEYPRDCADPAPPENITISGTATGPSGLTGTFEAKPTRHGRSGVQEMCDKPPLQSDARSYERIPRYYNNLALTKKRFTGAGMPTREWVYAYPLATGTWLANCGGSCDYTNHVDVTDPAGNVTRYTFSNRFDATEGNLLRTDYYSGAVSGNPIRSELLAYANPIGGPWPTQYGYNMVPDLNSEKLEQQAPLQTKTIIQDGDTYIWQATGFNEFAQVTQVKRFSNIANQAAIEERTSYFNDGSHWVLGLPLQVDNVTTGEIVSRNEYDPSSATLSKRWHFGQLAMSYTFNSQGLLSSFTDGNNRTTTLTNYKRGIPQAIAYPDGTGQSLTVDDLGQIRSITDQAGSTTSYGYDLAGRVTSVSYPGGDEAAWHPKSLAYDFVSGVERGISGAHWRRTVAKGDSRVVTYFDAMLRPVLTDTYIASDGGSHISARVDYDWKGQKIFAAYPTGGAMDLAAFNAGIFSEYDALGRLKKIQQTAESGFLTTSTAYLSGATKQVTDPKGYVTTTQYQIFDQPSYDAVTLVQAPEGVNQSIARDLYGNPTAIRQWGTANGYSVDVTKYLYYDAYHRLCRTWEPESGSEVTAYDAANNVAWTASGLSIAGNGCGQEQVADAAKITRTYDAMNRVKTLLPLSGTQSTVYTYDALGNVQQADSGISSWSGIRNKLGQLTSETLGVNGNGNNVIRYAHDSYGTVRTITYPDATVVDYAPDALGRPTQVGSFASSVSYHPDGDIAHFVYGNGTDYLTQKNARQLLSNFSYIKGGTVHLSEDFAYDGNGNITTISDLAGGPRSKALGYDALNRLTSAQANGLWGTETYRYDPINNIRNRVTAGQSFDYNYDVTNRLASISQAGSSVMTLGYDGRGNVINKNGNTLVFDAKNQLTSIPGFDTYAYDAAGRRVLKNPANGAGSTYYFYTQDGRLLYQFDASTAKTTDYIYLGKKLIARNETLQLEAPKSISFDSNPNNGSYTVIWKASPGATSYMLDESVDGGVTWVALNANLSGTGYAITNKQGGGYLYRVKSCAGSQCTGYTTSATLGVTPALPGISVPGGPLVGSYQVTWTAPVSTASYDVQEQVNGGAWVTVVGDTTLNSITRPGTSSGSYKYQVRAKNGYGDRGWVVSSAVIVDTTLGDPPPAPTTITVPATSYDGSVTISWSSAARATRYVLTQSPGGSAVYDGPNTSVTLSNLASGTYSFQVKACSSVGCSSATASNNLIVTRVPSAAPALTVPANSTNGSYTISWTAVTDATSYTLQESYNGGVWVPVQANGNTAWAASGRANGSYTYMVQACNVAGCSGWSSTGTITVLLPPPMPTGVIAPAAAYGPFTVSWNATPTATSYDLHQSCNNGPWVIVYSGASTATVITPGASATCWYGVYALNASGASAQAGFATVFTEVTLAPTGAPTLSVPASSNTGSYTVSWSGVAGASSYTLQEQFNGGGWNTVQANGANSWSATGKGNGTFGYRAQACNVGGCGSWSGTASAVVNLVPSVPDFRGPYLSTSGRIDSWTLYWDAVPGATRYEIVQVENGKTVYSGTNLSYVLESGISPYPWLENGYRLRACNSLGCSAWAADIY
ncbi:hypothetical protein [Dyella sp. 20L07]|uniref:hypothetical protein n=1 Tax=Dyella sp. 20L07 TaxID=3384240 RepID=UPI003D2C2336